MNPKAEWGIVGMGVMGTSLSRNFASKGFPLALFNRHLEGVEEKVALHKQQLYPELHLAQPFEELVPLLCSALAIADSNTFLIISAPFFGLKANIFIALSTFLPLIISATNLAFCGEILTPFKIAETSLAIIYFAFLSPEWPLYVYICCKLF